MKKPPPRWRRPFAIATLKLLDLEFALRFVQLLRAEARFAVQHERVAMGDPAGLDGAEVRGVLLVADEVCASSVRAERRRKDREFQEAVPQFGTCFNCGKYRRLGGDHWVKRRYRATRHDPDNRMPCCWPCNVDLENLSCEKLLAKFPDSPLREEWE